MSPYRKPGLAVRIANAALQPLLRLGLGVGGARELTVSGRRSGRPRTVPVNPLEYDGELYLVAPRGDTMWARNLRETGRCQLRLGRSTATYEATELAVSERPPLLRAYLERWPVTASMFDDISKDSSDDELRRAAPGQPVFRLTEVSGDLDGAPGGHGASSAPPE